MLVPCSMQWLQSLLRKKTISSDLSVSIVQCCCCAGSRRCPHLLMGALCATTLLLQVLLIALPLFLQQAQSGRGRRPSQDTVHRWPLARAVVQHPGETHPPGAQWLQTAALSFVVLGTEVQDGFQPLSLLRKTDQRTSDSVFHSPVPFRFWKHIGRLAKPTLSFYFNTLIHEGKPASDHIQQLHASHFLPLDWLVMVNW